MAYAQGTTKNIKCQWLSFITFCISFKLQYIPANVHTTKFVSVQSIKNYIHGVKLLHLYVGVSSPQMNDFSINLTLKGITRRLNHTPRQAAPITPDMLIQFRAHMDISKTLGATIWCAFLIAFYTMARKSNICPISRNAFTPTKHLCRRDIVHNQSGMVVIYKWSKTNQCGQRRHLVTLAPNVTEPVLCPLQAFNNMTRVVPAFAQSPAFLVPDSKRPHKLTTLTHELFVRHMRSLLSKCGYEPTSYTGHSFRRGGCTWASQLGVPVHDIKSIGDWKSNAFELYVPKDIAHKLSVSHKIMSSTIKSK